MDSIQSPTSSDGGISDDLSFEELVADSAHVEVIIFLAPCMTFGPIIFKKGTRITECFYLIFKINFQITYHHPASFDALGLIPRWDKLKKVVWMVFMESTYQLSEENE